MNINIISNQFQKIMEDQNQVSPQTASSMPQTPPPLMASPPPEPSHNGKVWKIVGIILIFAVVVFSLLVWYNFRLEKRDQSLSSNLQSNNASSLTVEKIKSLKVAANVGDDYFIGSPDEQSEIVDMFVKNNSASDSAYLYIAANTAHLLNRPKEAMFLFYAAQLRKSFDYERFALGKADGNNIQTYLGYLNQGAGQGINPLAIQNPKLFSEAIRMIEGWSIVPALDAYYPKESYGEAKLAKDQWQVVAEEKRDSFLNEFAYKSEKLFSDPKMVEAMLFVQEYNFGKIPRNSKNDQKYQEYLKKVSGTFAE